MALQLSACAPLINDISTDLDTPPQIFRVSSNLTTVELLAYPEEFKDVQRKAYPEIDSLILKGLEQDKLFSSIEKILEEMPRVQIVLRKQADKMGNQPESFLQAVFTTRIFRFRDDVVIRIQQLKDTQKVDIRSRSRLGKGDLGTNAARIRTLLATIRQVSLPDQNPPH